jgi:hypothetical protein
MNRKYGILVLALFVLSGCSKDERSVARVPSDGGGDINTIQPINTVVYSHIYDSVTDQVFTNTIKKFLAIAPDETVDDIDIGLVRASTSAQNEGLQILLKLGIPYSSFSSLSSVPSNNITLEVRIYDAYTYAGSTACSGAPCGPLRVSFYSGSAAVTNLSNGDTEISFLDSSGELWLTGRMNGDVFSGRMYFQNSLNPYNGAFGNFSIDKCLLFTNGCN